MGFTRAIAGLYPVTAMNATTFHSCSGTYTSACGPINSAFTGAHAGLLIDRAGLPAKYDALLVSVGGVGVVQASATACHVTYFAFSVGLQDAACSTAGWQDYSTGSFVTEQPGYFKSTSTSTADAWYNEALRTTYGVMTTAWTTSTSTGYAEVRAFAAFDLSAAKRFVRILVAPRIEQGQSTAVGSCGAGYVPTQATAIFGNPQVEPFAFSVQGPIIRSTGHSTSTST